MKPSGHTVLITGGSAGIGLALAKKFNQNNNRVIIVGRNEQKLAEVKKLLPKVSTLQCDIGDQQQLKQAVDSIRAEYNELNVLVNNAGIQYNVSFTKDAGLTDKIAEEIRTNFTVPAQLCAEFIPLLSSKEESAIINVSSGLGLVPKQSAPVYCGTKAGIHIFTKALRYQLEGTSIRVFEIIPPVVDTDMTKGRGKNKITPDELADEFFPAFVKNHLEVSIGRIKLLRFINRLSPSLAERILKNG